ncbi:MAG: hypothetical protein WC423_08820 [Vulcanimicrobiota bacterium]
MSVELVRMIKSKPLSLLYFLFIVLFLAGCAPSEPTVSQDTNKEFEVTLPPGWKMSTELNDEAEFQAEHVIQEKYLIVLTEPKDEVQEYANREEYSQATRTFVPGLKEEGPVELEIGGHPAVQYILRGKVDGYDVTYIHTIQETPDKYRQIMAWTLDSKYDSYKAELQGVIRSVKDVGVAPK